MSPFESLEFLLQMLCFVIQFNIILSHNTILVFHTNKSVDFPHVAYTLRYTVQNYFTKYFQCSFKINLVARIIRNLNRS